LRVEDGDGGARTLDASCLLIAAGRRPNTDMLDLERAGVETDNRGFIRVDDYLRTNVDHIWAVGDVNGQQPFTRGGQEEGRFAYANAFEDAGMTLPRERMPRAIFTDPEVGSVGVTEAEAGEAGMHAQAMTIPAHQFPRARLSGRTAGLVKFVIDEHSH